MRIALLVIVALSAAGCGGREAEPPRRVPSIAQLPYPTPSPPPDTAGPYRFVRPPIVVAFPGRDYRVYLRLDRALPSGSNAAEITLGDQTSNDEHRGHQDDWGYDAEYAAPNCYTKLIYASPDIPSALWHLRAGDLATVALIVRGDEAFASGRLGARARLIAAGPREYAPQADARRWHQLGCRA